MKKRMLPLALLTLIFAGCSGSLFSGEYYSIEPYAEDSDYSVVTMKTYDPASKEFQFRFENEAWTIEERPEEEAINHVVLVHTAYEDGSCTLLPGTIGKGTPDGALVYDGSLLTENHVARTVEIVSGAGIRLLYAVGYEVDGIPYIFEINFPEKDQDDCEIDGQLVINSFKVIGGEETPVSEESVVEETPVDANSTEVPVE